MLAVEEARVAHSIPPSYLLAAAGLAARKGWDVDALLGAAGIPPPQITGPRPWLSDDQLRDVTRACLRLTDDDLLGLGAGPVPRGSLRMICFAIASAVDLEHALTRFAACARAVPGLSPIRLEVRGADAVLSVDTSGLDDPDQLLSTVTMLATHRVLGWLIGRRVPVRHIQLPYPEPADPTALNQLFDEPLRFCGTHAAITMSSAVLPAPIVQTERSLLDYLRNAPTALLRGEPEAGSLTRGVRRAIENGLRDHEPTTAAELAGRLAMSEPTLRRKLRAEGTSLREIRDEIRRGVAVASLERGGEPIAALAERLGFSEPSAFTRAFRRWTGRAPTRYRREPSTSGA